MKSSLIREWKIEKQRRDTIASVTHDLNTPLTVIQLSADGLLSGLYENREKLISYLGNINKNAKLASTLLEEIKVVSKLDNPEFTLCGQPVDIEDFICGKADSYKLLTQQQISFNVGFTDNRTGKGDFILDPDKVSRIMDNIVSNSLRHTPPGGEILLDVEANDELTRFTVQDSGEGFRQKDIPYLFNMFYKGDNSRAQDKRRMGLGLYIAKLIVELHGGTIHAGNNPYKGAFVTFTIKPLNSF